MQPDTEPARPDHNIAMWGAPGSGKTTLLAALNIALVRRNRGWKVVGANDASTDFLEEKTVALTTAKEFPPATQGLEHYHWLLIGPSERQEGRRSRKGAAAEAPRIGVDLLDPPGGVYGGKRGQSAQDQKRLLDNLTQSRGIVFLFDPIREFVEGDAYQYLASPLAHLAQRMLVGNEYADGKLPHHIAVCLTKFDEFKVLKTAEQLGLLTRDPDDPYGFPRVVDDDAAKQLFRELCAISASGNADMVLNALDQYFHPDRVKFFVTSSIGFYVDHRRNVFDPDDFKNLKPGGSGVLIRGQVHPINVMEPMLWLCERLSGERISLETER